MESLLRRPASESRRLCCGDRARCGGYSRSPWVYTIGTYAEQHNLRPVPHRPGGHGTLLSFPAAGRRPQHAQIIPAGARPTSGNLGVESILPRREGEPIFLAKDIARERAEAVLVLPDSLFGLHTAHSFKVSPQRVACCQCMDCEKRGNPGGLMSYGVDVHCRIVAWRPTSTRS